MLAGNKQKKQATELSAVAEAQKHQIPRKVFSVKFCVSASPEQRRRMIWWQEKTKQYTPQSPCK